jgi:hypothetical protein
MTPFVLDVPIVLIIFNRPELTARVFAAIRKAKPTKLFVIADGPREHVPEDVENCRKAREIITQVDWQCQVFQNYSAENLGCGVRPATGITWVFDQVEEAIILEDDCLPHPTFFRYCAELLTHYRDDERIMAISGNNFQFGNNPTLHSYYFSIFPHCAGWASWRRAWKYYDYQIELLPTIEDGDWLYNIFSQKKFVKYWLKEFRSVYKCKQKHIWDYQWTFCCWIQSGLCIIPCVNLISNIGYGPSATHTKETCLLANIPSHPMNFPIIHPEFVVRNLAADQFTQIQNFDYGAWSRLKTFLRNKIFR